MRVLHCPLGLLLIVVGCSQSVPSPPATPVRGVGDTSQRTVSAAPASSTGNTSQGGAIDEREAGSSWEQFISEAKTKTRKNGAKIEWDKKYEKGALIAVEILRDDIRRDSARGVMVGEVQITATELTLSSPNNLQPNGRYGKGVGNVCKYTLRFRFKSGTWEFMDGVCRVSDFQNPTDSKEISVERLGSHLLILFGL